MNTYKNILEMVGNTPLLEIKEGSSSIFLKLENHEPTSSVKDRAASYIIKDAEERGLLKKGSSVFESTSGNTGIALAMICAVKGYKFVVTMPSSASEERKKLLRLLGATLVETDPKFGILGAKEKAIELSKKEPGSIIANQFENMANVKAHYETTGVEILNQLDKVDILVAGFGTGGTISGTGKRLREKFKDLKIIAVEPFESPLLSKGQAGPHKIQGLGANIIPDILDKDIIDEVFTVKSQDAIDECKRVIKEKGLLCGISSGANIYAAKEIAKKYPNSNIVTFVCDTAERYLSVLEA